MWFWLVVVCWVHCRGQELSREEVLSWFRGRVLDSLGLRGAPRVDGGKVQAIPRRVLGISQRQLADDRSQSSLEIILFPVSDSCDQNHLTYHFQPSDRYQLVWSAHFWFYGGTVNSSASLFILTSDGKLLQGLNPPSKSSPDGWMIFDVNQSLRTPLVSGPFLLRVLCSNCHCHTEGADNMPFLHLHARPGSARTPRSVPGPIPWSPSAVDLLQRPSQERLQDCGRAEVQISFQELGWDNWIVDPEVLTFYYCHGNCSAPDRTSTVLGIRQCCAPVPETMRSLRIITTSDGGYSYKHETLPNIIPEECTCV
ncbi:inhibin alpha chain [Nerophis lumbriciformis]|uniref:inhibin alpha chain n=1 Tax=Nerophis lumbriciformis TaxID=546530 RepID=UPI002ADFB69F|nr:inhibin alpha chain [Nerophis lumbriciformis]